MTIKTRAQAHADGENKYYTGTPCKHGHDAQRWTYNGVCVVCHRAAGRKYQMPKVRVNTISEAEKISGVKFVSFKVHPADIARVREFTDALLESRIGIVPDLPFQMPAVPQVMQVNAAKLNDMAARDGAVPVAATPTYEIGDTTPIPIFSKPATDLGGGYWLCEDENGQLLTVGPDGKIVA